MTCGDFAPAGGSGAADFVRGRHHLSVLSGSQIYSIASFSVDLIGCVFVPAISGPSSSGSPHTGLVGRVTTVRVWDYLACRLGRRFKAFTL